MPDFLIVTEARHLHDKNDVVVVNLNGFEWGKLEYDEPFFRIIVIPDADMTMLEARTWVSLQVGFSDRDKPNGNPNLKYRAKTFNEVLLPSNDRAQLAKARVLSRRENGRNVRDKNADLELPASVFRAISSMKPIIPK